MTKSVIINEYVLVILIRNSSSGAYLLSRNYEGWNFNSGNYLFTTDTK